MANVPPVLEWILPFCAERFLVPQLSLVWKQSKINHKKPLRGYQDFFQADPELVGARDVERAECGIAVLLQPCQVVSSRSTVCTWSILQTPVHPYLVPLHLPFL